MWVTLSIRQFVRGRVATARWCKRMPSPLEQRMGARHAPTMPMLLEICFATSSLVVCAVSLFARRLLWVGRAYPYITLHHHAGVLPKCLLTHLVSHSALLFYLSSINDTNPNSYGDFNFHSHVDCYTNIDGYSPTTSRKLCFFCY